MTQEEKAKRYDEVLEQAKNWYVDAQIDFKKSLETLLPELKESEDERIKKALIEYFSMGASNNETTFNIEDKKILAWLEKQGTTQKPFTFNSLPRLLGMIEPSDRAVYYSNKLADSLENEGYATDSKIVRESIKIMRGEKVPMATMDETEGGSTGKPDKVSPRFGVFSWVCDGISTRQVTQVLDCGFYVFDDGFNSRCEDVDSKYHLWTIQDAKNGDVLATPNYIYIFNSADKETETVAFYCLIKKSDKHFSFGDYRIHDEILNSTPATKKQYDILIKAMTDAGYAFDFEKKELKETEDEEYNGEDYGIDGLYHAQRILEKTLGSVDGYQTDDGILSHKCAITAVKKLYEQKPTGWSEEDEDYYDAIVAKLEVTQDDAALTDNQMEFLKSLKGRVQLKQEWSEEDEERLSSCIQLLKTSDGFDTINTKWLKSLKERYTWKPSDEQLKSLKEVIDVGHFTSYPNALEILYEQLKKLMEDSYEN